MPNALPCTPDRLQPTTRVGEAWALGLKDLRGRLDALDAATPGRYETTEVFCLELRELKAIVKAMGALLIGSDPDSPAVREAREEVHPSP